jgi:outer membrane assembly lipoprotein YfiO
MNARRRLLWPVAALAAALVCWGEAACAAELQWQGGQWVAQSQPAAGSPQADLDNIRRLHDAGKYSRAASAAKTFLKKHPDAPQREEVYVLYGQAEINRGRYFQAYEVFQKQLDEFPSGPWSQRALVRQYQIGDAFLLGRKRLLMGLFPVPAYDDGVDILNRVAEQTPGSDLAEKSLLRVGDYYFSDRQYDQAIGTYDRYLQLFGKSDQAPFAMLRAADASLASFEGVGHDVTPLLEARSRYASFSERFPAEARKASVAGTLERIDGLRANDDFAKAEYYHHAGRPTAAAYYYRQVIQRHDGTGWADRSRSALASMGEPLAPAVPRSLMLPPRRAGAATQPAPKAAIPAATTTTTKAAGPPAAPPPAPATAPAGPTTRPTTQGGRTVTQPIELENLLPSQP